MKVATMVLIIGSSFSVFAQTGVPDKGATQAETFKQEERQRIEQSFETMRKLGEKIPLSPKVLKTIPPPLPALTKEELASLAPEPADSKTFESFLKTPKTGLIKLFPDLNCESKFVVSAESRCEGVIPMSSFYSFRRADYSIPELSDVKLKDNAFISSGVLSQGIIVALGDVGIDGISVNSPGLKFLADYQPARQSEEALAKSKVLINGVKADGYDYSYSIPVVENATYAVRVIAYKGSVLKQLYANAFYDLLETDKRIDIIVAFRVVRKDGDGALTLIWKELQRKDAPRIKLSKEEKKKYKIDPV